MSVVTAHGDSVPRHATYNLRMRELEHKQCSKHAKNLFAYPFWDQQTVILEPRWPWVSEESTTISVSPQAEALDLLRITGIYQKLNHRLWSCILLSFILKIKSFIQHTRSSSCRDSKPQSPQALSVRDAPDVLDVLDVPDVPDTWGCLEIFCGLEGFRWTWAWEVSFLGSLGTYQMSVREMSVREMKRIGVHSLFVYTLHVLCMFRSPLRLLSRQMRWIFVSQTEGQDTVSIILFI